VTSEQITLLFSSKIDKILEKFDSLERTNLDILESTGIINFFNQDEDLVSFRDFLTNSIHKKKSIKDFGDFQTPDILTDRICKFLSQSGFNPTILIEPTCGEGNFVISALKHFSNLKHIFALDIQSKYEWIFKIKLANFQFTQSDKVTIHFFKQDIFNANLNQLVIKKLGEENSNILVLGNPPWVTNTELSKLESKNVPKKSNKALLRGLDALTGKANFDISENIILSTISQLPKGTDFSFLCKTIVMRNIVNKMDKFNINLENNKCFLIDTLKEFNVNTSAGLYIFKKGNRREKICKVHSFYQPNKLLYKFGLINKKFVSNIDLYNNYGLIDGKSLFIWRQGIKHDASKILVLKKELSHLLTNSNEERIDIENNLVYPLIKSSQINKTSIRETDKFLIVTQTFVGQETGDLKNSYPRTWNYLLKNEKFFTKRKSVIYRNKPKFSIFGVGEYTFKPFKIAVSGFNKKLIFSLILPVNNKPVVFDDTCYYLSFEDKNECLITWAILNSDVVSNFLSSLIFIDNKRPYTKEVLMRIDFRKINEILSYEDFSKIFSKLNYKNEFNSIEKEDYDKFIQSILVSDSKI
jgi:hypothetical protein